VRFGDADGEPLVGEFANFFWKWGEKILDSSGFCKSGGCAKVS
jgi:hypothetical protein